MERHPRQPEERVISKPKNVYVKISDVIDDVEELKSVLTSKVNTPGMTEVTPTDICIHGGSTYCTLVCNSRTLAKKLKNLLLKVDGGEGTREQPVIDCSFDEFEPSKAERQRKEEFRRAMVQEFDRRQDPALQVHEQKLTQTQKDIDTLNQKLKALNKLSQTRESVAPVKEKLKRRFAVKQTKEEIKALENKLEELQSQKKTFMTALDGFRQQLDSLLTEDDYERKVESVLKRLEVECRQLERALPMYARRQDIVQLVQQHRVSVLQAETGSGKSTQVVQYLLDAGFGERGTIVCTQPREMAAVSLATHVAQELAGEVGKDVGYRVGSRVKASSSTKVIFMTDQALLNECLTDPDLKAFSCVVVDEAHERSLYTDLLLTVVKRCVARNPDLRVVITSATIDPQVFVDFFNKCKVMRISGRTFPVDVEWKDSASDDDQFDNYVEAAVSKAMQIHQNKPSGDILVFLTSPSEIQKSCDLLQQRLKDCTDFTYFQLHGRLQAEEQQRVLQPLDGSKRKIVFATNCAETSITIDGVKYVVDTGVVKEMRYDAKRNIRSLKVGVVSRSSAEQRKGRAGRTAPGTCYRLYSQTSFLAMDTISQPEILNTHLGHALLKLAELGVTQDMYDFVQHPGQDAIDAALKTLHQLGALSHGEITDAGRWIARLPFDPRLGMLIFRCRDQGVLYDAIVLAALVSAESWLFYTGQTEAEPEKLDSSKVKFSHPGGDCLASLEVYKAWEVVGEEQKSQWCVDNSVDAKVICGVMDTVNDVCSLLKNKENLEVTHIFSEAPDTPDVLRKILFKCNVSNLCCYLGRQKAGYFAAQAGRQVHFHPSSTLSSLGSYPQWVVYDQLVQTSRDFITGITPVDDAWLREMSKESLGFDVEEIRQIGKKLVKVFTQPAGSSAFSALVGPLYTKLRQFRECSDISDCSVVFLEASREAGEVRVYSTDAVCSVENLTRKLTEVVNKAAEDVQREVLELSVGSQDSGVRVVLGLGAQVIDILMPHETRKVFINNPSKDVSEETLKQKFKRFGEVCFCYPYSDSKLWGFLLFQKKSEAVKAADATKNDRENVAILEQLYSPRFRARLKCNRRFAKGYAFVKVSPTYFSKCLEIKSLEMGGKKVQIEKNLKEEEEDEEEKKKSLYLTNLPVDVTGDLIKRELLLALGEEQTAPDVFGTVIVPHEDKAADKTRLEDLIRKKFQEHLTSSTVCVSLYEPKTDTSVMVEGEARFSDPREGLSACKKLQGCFQLNYRHRVSVEPNISATLRVPERVYNVCREQVDEVIKTKIADMRVDASSKQVDADNWQIWLKADDIDKVTQAKDCLSHVTKGEVLDCSHSAVLKPLLTSAGRQMLCETETSAYVSVDSRRKTISIHGPLEARKKGEYSAASMPALLLMQHAAFIA